MIEENELPEGWNWTTIGTITAINPRLDISLMLESTPVSFVPMAAVEAGTGCVDTSTQRQLKEVKKGYTAFRENDVLFAKITPCMENGKSAVVRSLYSGIGFGSTEFHVLRMTACIDPQLLYYYVSQEVFRQNARAYMTGTAGQLRVPPAFLADAPFPLAPLPEQHRIVTAIEQQFTRLDAAVTALQHARTKLKRYRAAVLKAAVEGKLTEVWRAEHPATEPASALLERILVERRVKWDADQRAKGKDPAKGKYVEPAKPDVESLPTLPTGWCWATVEQVADVIGGVTKGRNLAGRLTMTLPYLRVANVQRGFINTDVMKTIEVPEDEVGRYLLHMGDVLLTEGGDADKLGRAALWEKPIEKCIHQNHIFRARVTDLNITPLWLVHYANSEQGKAYFLKAAKQTVNLASINLTQLRNCPFPLPPNVEQEQIVAEVERSLSIISTLEMIVEANLKRAERLRQSILKEAFAGRLVPQDTHDEPASVLLERIQKELEGQKPGPGKKAREPKTIAAPRMPDGEPVDIDTSEMEQMDLWTCIGSRE